MAVFLPEILRARPRFKPDKLRDVARVRTGMNQVPVAAFCGKNQENGRTLTIINPG